MRLIQVQGDIFHIILANCEYLICSVFAARGGGWREFSNFCIEFSKFLGIPVTLRIFRQLRLFFQQPSRFFRQLLFSGNFLTLSGNFSDIPPTLRIFRQLRTIFPATLTLFPTTPHTLHQKKLNLIPEVQLHDLINVYTLGTSLLIQLLVCVLLQAFLRCQHFSMLMQ